MLEVLSSVEDWDEDEVVVPLIEIEVLNTSSATVTDDKSEETVGIEPVERPSCEEVTLAEVVDMSTPELDTVEVE